jgi:transcriptional/translational regulatory protein YebC/TACO1
MNGTAAKFVRFERKNGKLALVYDVMNKTGEYVMAQFTTSPQFRSIGAARKAIVRVDAALAKTGAFPNCCAWF